VLAHGELLVIDLSIWLGICHVGKLSNHYKIQLLRLETPLRNMPVPDVVSMNGNGPEGTERLPSWAPDFSHGESKCLVHPLSARFTPFVLPTQQFDGESRTLTCQCVDTGTLGHVLWDRPSDLHHTLIEDPHAIQRILDANAIHEYDISGQGRPVQVKRSSPR
jgi:hypothetical protein